MKISLIHSLKYLRFVMPLFYLVFGTLLLCTSFLAEETGHYGRIAGGLMVIYGIFRFYRVVKEVSGKESDETAR